MKHCCKNCQFLSKWALIAFDQKRLFSWTKEEREKLGLTDSWAAECSVGIWSTGIDGDLRSRLKEVLTEDRKDRCFFIEVHEGMSNQGARALHKLRNDNAQLKKSYRYTQIGLGIAAGSILATLVYNIIRDFVLRLL